MKTDVQNPKPKKAAKSLDDEITALQEKLARLQAQKREKERKELERNQKAIAAFLRTEKLDTVPVEKWTAALPGLRKLLKVEEPKGATPPGPAAASGPQPTASQAKGGHSAAASKAAQPEAAEALSQTA
jgi:hypothetical protein